MTTQSALLKAREALLECKRLNNMDRPINCAEVVDDAIADLDRAIADGDGQRELFAAMAMQGMCANSIPGSHHHPTNTAREAVAKADALLAELRNTSPTSGEETT